MIDSYPEYLMMLRESLYRAAERRYEQSASADPFVTLCGFNTMSNARAIDAFVSRRMRGWDTSRIR